MRKTIRIATRSSPLARWQAHHVAQSLRQAWPGLRCQFIPVISSADSNLQTPLYGMGNTGVFVKEVQHLLLENHADIAVHSCKDLPTEHVEQLCLAAICKRHDPRDALIGAASLDDLHPGACIGTSSLRRRAHLRALRPDLRFENIRGNVGTRLEKINNGDYDATLMAYAGLKRLGIEKTLKLKVLNPYTECCPAPAQGAIAVDCRSERSDMQHLLAAIDHPRTRRAISIERAVLHGLRGGCSLPFGCLVRQTELRWHLFARLSPDSGAVKTVDITGHYTGLSARALALLGA